VIVWVIVVVVLLGVLVASLLLRRHGESAQPGSGWTSTDEVFRDPSTGRVMRVWIDPVDGSRHYVPDAGSGEHG
jgi:hypothetical protein